MDTAVDWTSFKKKLELPSHVSTPWVIKPRVNIFETVLQPRVEAWEEPRGNHVVNDWF